MIMVTLVVTGKDIFSQNEAKILVKKHIDLCKLDDNRFVFAVNIGEIKTTDSLFGFDIEITYDSNKIKIINVLTGNTLSEIFDEKDFSFAFEGNKIKGYVTTMQMNIKPPSGNKDLIAFYADWIGDTKCEDSSLISITRLEFTDEFKLTIDNFIPGYVYTKLIPNNESKFTISTDSKIYTLKSGETQLNVSYYGSLTNNHKVENIIMKFVDDKVLKIQEVDVRSKDVKLESFGSDYIKLNLINQPNTFDINVTYDYVLNDTVSNYIYKSSEIRLNKCNCIGQIDDNISFIINKDSVFSSISNVDEFLKYDCRTNTITITNNKIKKIKFVDILGRELENIEIQGNKNIDLNNMSANMIFAIIEINNKYEIKKFYKCY